MSLKKRKRATVEYRAPLGLGEEQHIAENLAVDPDTNKFPCRFSRFGCRRTFATDEHHLRSRHESSKDHYQHRQTEEIPDFPPQSILRSATSLSSSSRGTSSTRSSSMMLLDPSHPQLPDFDLEREPLPLLPLPQIPPIPVVDKSTSVVSFDAWTAKRTTKVPVPPVILEFAALKQTCALSDSSVDKLLAFMKVCFCFRHKFLIFLLFVHFYHLIHKKKNIHIHIYKLIN